MFSFQTARKTMVDCQINPSGVVDPRVLSAFEAIPRELFVTGPMRAMAYCDETLYFDDGRFMLSPMVLGRRV